MDTNKIKLKIVFKIDSTKNTLSLSLVFFYPKYSIGSKENGLEHDSSNPTPKNNSSSLIGCIPNMGMTYPTLLVSDVHHNTAMGSGLGALDVFFYIFFYFNLIFFNVFILF